MSGVWRLSPGLSLSNSSALGCQLNISDHLGRWHMPQPMSTPTCNASVLLNNLFQAVPSFKSKKGPKHPTLKHFTCRQVAALGQT